MEPVVCDNGQIILDDVIDENYVPTVEEIREYAEILEIDPDKEPDLLWIAKECLCAPLPENWKPCQDVNGELYYFNFATGESTWDHPSDDFYKAMAREERRKAKKRSKKRQSHRVEDPLVARPTVKSPAFGNAQSGRMNQAGGNGATAAVAHVSNEVEFSLGTLNMQLGDIGYEESETSDIGPGIEGVGGAESDRKSNAAVSVHEVRSSDEEESDEVDFKDDQSLSDKLIASTDKLPHRAFSPSASLNGSLVTPPKTPRSSINKSPRKAMLQQQGEEAARRQRAQLAADAAQQRAIVASSVGGDASSEEAQNSGSHLNSDLYDRANQVKAKLEESWQQEYNELNEKNQLKLRALRADLAASLQEEERNLRESHDMTLQQLREKLRQEHAEKKKQYNREAEESIAALQKEVERMKREEANSLQKQKDELLDQLRQQFPDFEAERSKIIADHESALAKMTSELSRQLETKMANRKSELEADYELREKRLTNKYQDMLKEKEADYKSELETLKSRNSESLLEHRKRMERDLQNDIEDLSAQHKRQLKLSEQEMLARERAMKDSAKSEFESEMQRLKDKYDSLLSEREDWFKRKLAEVEQSHREQLQASKARLEKELEAELEQVRLQHRKAIDASHSEKDEKETELRAMIEELEESKRQVQRQLGEMGEVARDKGLPQPGGLQAANLLTKQTQTEHPTEPPESSSKKSGEGRLVEKPAQMDNAAAVGRSVEWASFSDGEESEQHGHQQQRPPLEDSISDDSSGFSSTEDLLAALSGTAIDNGGSLDSTNGRLQALMKTLNSDKQKGTITLTTRSKTKLGVDNFGQEEPTRSLNYETAEEMMARKWKTYFGNVPPHSTGRELESGGGGPVGYGYVPASELLRQFRRDEVLRPTGAGVSHAYNNWLPPAGSVEQQLRQLNKWLSEFRSTMPTVPDSPLLGQAQP